MTALPPTRGVPTVDRQILLTTKTWFKTIGVSNGLSPIIAALISVAGVFGGIYFGFRQFKKQQETNRDQVYWAKQFDAYKEACDAAGAIASAATIDDVAAEREAFERLYWGVMCVIEHENVESAMYAFYQQLKTCEQRRAQPSSLKAFAYGLAHECRKSLQTTWRPDNIGELKTDRNIKLDAPNE